MLITGAWVTINAGRPNVHRTGSSTTLGLFSSRPHTTWQMFGSRSYDCAELQGVAQNRQRVTGHQTVEVVMKHYFRPGREDFRTAILEAMPNMRADTSGRKSIKEEILALLDKSAARTWKADIHRLRALIETLPR
jgi:hypothetical protein